MINLFLLLFFASKCFWVYCVRRFFSTKVIYTIILYEIYSLYIYICICTYRNWNFIQKNFLNCLLCYFSTTKMINTSYKYNLFHKKSLVRFLYQFCYQSLVIANAIQLYSLKWRFAKTFHYTILFVLRSIQHMSHKRIKYK